MYHLHILSILYNIHERADDFYVLVELLIKLFKYYKTFHLKLILQINISGVYHLESHDSGYADYLLAMDIPEAAVPHILAA